MLERLAKKKPENHGKIMALRPSLPVEASFPSDKLTIGAGVAIFHLASARVVVCYHSRDKYWFLPKGRRNANEDTGRAAEREGFEESGFRNRLLPLPFKHRQPQPDDGPRQIFFTEPLWTQFLPLTATAQYLLFWYAAETVPEDVERICARPTGAEAAAACNYQAPPKFPDVLSLKDRICQDSTVDAEGVKRVYQPVRHEDTGVNEEEALYRSYLLPIEEAISKLKGSVMGDVVRRGWESINVRMEMESAAED